MQRPRLARLRLTSFRNYPSVEWTPDARVICLSGKNGAGKTNLLEAVHYLCMGRGLRGQHDRYAVHEGDLWFSIQAEWQDAPVHRETVNVQPGRGKRVFFEDQPLSRISLLVGKIPVICCLPDDTRLLSDPAEVRRKFLDAMLSQASAEYLENLIRYEHHLDQRNALLRQAAENGIRPDEGLMHVYDEALTMHGIPIREARERVCASLSAEAGYFLDMLQVPHESYSLVYETQTSGMDEKQWTRHLAQGRIRDTGAGRTLFGVHRDDLIFRLNGEEARYRGSQGQQKTLVLALRMAQARWLEKHAGSAPVLLLDDIFDKLDEYRLTVLANWILDQTSGQVFVTDTSADRLHQAFGSHPDVSYLHVTNGNISRDGET